MTWKCQLFVENLRYLTRGNKLRVTVTCGYLRLWKRYEKCTKFVGKQLRENDCGRENWIAHRPRKVIVLFLR